MSNNTVLRLHRVFGYYINQLKNRMGLLRSVAVQKLVPELMRKSHANRNNLFWKPCPNCNENFGGSEIKYTHPIKVESSTKNESVSYEQCICPLCSIKLSKYDDYNKRCLGFALSCESINKD